MVLQNGLVRINKLLPPELALTISPGDARSNAAMASMLLMSDAQGKGKSEAATYVKAALRRDATNVEAARNGGLIADASNDNARARQSLRFAEALSRRDLPTQLWLLEDAVNRGDVGTALDHFDIALRTSNDASKILVPILVRAIDEPPLAHAIVAVLARRPIWAEGYLITVAQTGQDNAKVADLFLNISKAGVPVPQYIRDTLIRRFVDAGDFILGMRLYRAFYSKGGNDLIRNGGFELSDANVAFDWRPVDTAGISALRTEEKGNIVLQIQGSPTEAGPAIRQLLVLPVGRYAIGGTFQSPNETAATSPYFDLTCAGPQSIAIGHIVMTSGKFRGIVSVPESGCEAQWLTLSVPSTESSDGSAGTVDNISVERM
ncbi:MAG: hypothetical protein ABIR08_05765 [Sphingomonas sp.]